MNIELTSIQNKTLNLDLDDLRKLLTFVRYPSYLREFHTLCVMVVSVKDEKHHHDAYLLEGKPYISIALEYSAVAGISYEEITVLCKQELITYLFSLSSLPVKELV